jgi:NAD(P)-dependent dehydrogenase (short-subunit alcohol dehydrogenase family)
MSLRAAQIAGHLNWPQGLLAGQVAIITGSGQGIGAEAARLFANEGAKVIVQDIDACKNLRARKGRSVLTSNSQGTSNRRRNRQGRRPGHCSSRRHARFRIP